MSSGLPHHPQQSLQSLQSLPPSPFALSYLFPTPTHSPFAAFAHQQRIKLKRSRQRVDAGEPRNSYQQPPRTTSSREDEVNMSAGSVEQLTAYFPWMKNMEQTNINEDEEDLIKEEQPTDLSINGNGSEGKDDSGEYFEELDKLDVVNTSDEKLDDSEVHDAPVSTGSAQSSVSSASKRKSFLPQRNVTPQDIEERELEEEENLDDTDPANDTTEGSLIDGESKHEQEGADNESTGIVLPSGEIVEGLSALQSQLSAPSQRLTDMMEAQRRIYAQFAEQQRSAAMNPSVDQEKPRIQKQFGKLAQTLKQEVVDALTLSIDKIIADFAAAEVARLQAEAAQAIQQHQQQQQQQHQRPMIFPAFPGFQPGNHMGNPFGLAPPGGPSGIFPNAFNPFANPLAALNAGMRRPNMDDDGPRKKRNKVTDCFRARPGFSCSSSPRQSPQLSSNPSLPNYFPPTMVGHPLYGGGTFDEREESPTNSDEMSDCGGFNDGATSHTLTPMHLRKAKLMFFFTRYPNSSLLKSYFPDIRFNKNNTAQLVKWFSNFREFYYIQIEKMAKQALAEGVKNREDIHVTKESDIFKQLNQHYNRNNHIEAPDRLVWVVQETLREFFVALQNKRDEEPSWKKPIYKVICRLDDPIPEYFKDPNFLDRLE